jgi:hypothetical protein
MEECILIVVVLEVVRTGSLVFHSHPRNSLFTALLISLPLSGDCCLYVSLQAGHYVSPLRSTLQHFEYRILSECHYAMLVRVVAFTVCGFLRI